MTIIPGPVPPYTNPPIEPQFYQPSQFFVSQLTLSTNTQITTIVPNNYVIGQQVRIIVASSVPNLVNINGLSGYIIQIVSSTVFVINVNTAGLGPVNNSSFPNQSVQVVAIGDINSGQTNANGPQATLTYVPGSFINISPS